jgi:flavin reductase (DIM6/NTAB) family NADH-FMN oxidoreductase RutF/rubredoxin
MNPFHRLTYGLYIVTSRKGQKLNGYIANTAFQVTSDPPQIAVSCHKDNLTTSYIKKSGVFAISVLGRDAGDELLQTFGYMSGDDIGKFKTIEYKNGITGAPIVLQDTIAYFECKVKGSYKAGSHIVFFGEVVDSEIIDAEKKPLTYDYYRDVKKAFAPKNAPTYVDPGMAASDPKSMGGPLRLSADRDDKDVEHRKEYVCVVCGYTYDPAEGDPKNGIAPGTPFEEIPNDWVCPVCRAGKEYFKEMD